MALVAKKKAKPEVPVDDAPEGSGLLNVLVRGLDPALVGALDQQAKRTRRSRNQLIILVLEEAMHNAGLWSPPDTKAQHRST
jgi:hypothetical protein